MNRLFPSPAWRRALPLVAALVSLGAAVLAATQSAPPAAPAAKPAAPLPKLSDPLDGGWPREMKTSAGTFTVYQPQIDAWDGSQLALYAAVSLREKPDSTPVYGVVWVDGATIVDKDKRLVSLSQQKVRKVAFPSEPQKNAAILEFSVDDQTPAITASFGLTSIGKESCIEDYIEHADAALYAAKAAGRNRIEVYTL